MRRCGTIGAHRPSGLPARLMFEDTGQDVVEYAFLTAFLGVTGILLWDNIVTGIGGAYQSWDTGTQNLWEPPDPI